MRLIEKDVISDKQHSMTNLYGRRVDGMIMYRRDIEDIVAIIRKDPSLAIELLSTLTTRFSMKGVAGE